MNSQDDLPPEADRSLDHARAYREGRMPDEMNRWMTIEIGVHPMEGADLQAAGERALRAIMALIHKEGLPGVGLALDGFQVRRGAPGDRWWAFTDDELGSISHSQGLAEGEYGAGNELDQSLAAEISAELERRSAP